MSLKKKFVSTVALTFAVGAFTTFAAAQNAPAPTTDSMQNQERVERTNKRGYGKGMRGGRHGGDRMMLRSLGKLDLSDAQKEQVRVVFENHKTQNQPQMEEMRGLMQKKRDGVISADEQNRLQNLKTQMKLSKDQLNASITAILTAEQRAELDKLKEEMRQRMIERRQNRQNQMSPAPQDN